MDPSVRIEERLGLEAFDAIDRMREAAAARWTGGFHQQRWGSPASTGACIWHPLQASSWNSLARDCKRPSG